MIFKSDRRGRKKKQKKVWRWKGEEIEQVDQFTYLGYQLTSDNKDDEHIKKQVAKGNALLGKVWSIGEKTGTKG